MKKLKDLGFNRIGDYTNKKSQIAHSRETLICECNMVK